MSVPTFKAGALEEFGLVVFRDIALFVDENSSASQKQTVFLSSFLMWSIHGSLIEKPLTTPFSSLIDKQSMNC